MGRVLLLAVAVLGCGGAAEARATDVYAVLGTLGYDVERATLPLIDFAVGPECVYQELDVGEVIELVRQGVEPGGARARRIRGGRARSRRHMRRPAAGHGQGGRAGIAAAGPVRRCGGPGRRRARRERRAPAQDLQRQYRTARRAAQPGHLLPHRRSAGAGPSAQAGWPDDQYLRRRRPRERRADLPDPGDRRRLRAPDLAGGVAARQPSRTRSPGSS